MIRESPLRSSFVWPGGSGWATVYVPKSLSCSETCQFFVWYDTSGCRRQVVRLWSITSSVVAGEPIRFQPLLKDQSMVLLGMSHSSLLSFRFLPSSLIQS